MKKSYFDKGFLEFFMELAPNNNKEWFDANRSRYIKSVKEPFEAFVTDLIQALKKDYALGDLKASECIFRINKDIRFSKDKTPYKLQMSALIKKGGRKSMHESGLYIEFGPEYMHIYSGVYMTEKPQLEAIRNKIAKSTSQFMKSISSADFKKYFGTPKGEKSKILPKELKPVAGTCEYIYNKQFYVQHTVDGDKILETDVLDYIVKVYNSANAFNAFLDV